MRLLQGRQLPVLSPSEAWKLVFPVCNWQPSPTFFFFETFTWMSTRYWGFPWLNCYPLPLPNYSRGWPLSRSAGLQLPLGRNIHIDLCLGLPWAYGTDSSQQAFCLNRADWRSIRLGQETARVLCGIAPEQSFSSSPRDFGCSVLCLQGKVKIPRSWWG